MANDDEDIWNDIQAAREEDKLAAAKLVWSENPNATPEEAAGMIDVARREAHRKQKRLGEVLQAPRFSGFSPKYERYQEVQDFGPGHPHYEAIKKMVDLAYEPKRKPSSATNYYATKEPPYWAPYLTEVYTQGEHTFGREMSPKELGYAKKKRLPK